MIPCVNGENILIFDRFYSSSPLYHYWLLCILKKMIFYETFFEKKRF